VEVLDTSIAPDLAYLKTVADGEFTVGSRSDDDTRWLVNYVVDDGPARTYLYERSAGAGGKDEGKAGKATFLFTNRSALEKAELAKMHPVVITSRDGLKLVSYLTLPRGRTRTGGRRSRCRWCCCARRALGAGLVGVQRVSPVAGESRVRGSERELPRVDGVRQAVRDAANLEWATEDAR